MNYECLLCMGRLPWWLSGKNSACQYKRCRRHGFKPWSGRSPAVGNGNPLKYFCLKSAMEREAWWATVHRSQSQTWLSTCVQTSTLKRKHYCVFKNSMSHTCFGDSQKVISLSPSQQHFFWMPTPSPSLLPLQSTPIWLLFSPPHQNCFWQDDQPPGIYQCRTSPILLDLPCQQHSTQWAVSSFWNTPLLFPFKSHSPSPYPTLLASLSWTTLLFFPLPSDL